MRGPYQQGLCAQREDAFLHARGGAAFGSNARGAQRSPRGGSRPPGGGAGELSTLAANAPKIAAVARRSWLPCSRPRPLGGAPASRQVAAEGRPRRPSRLLRLLATAGQLRCGKRRRESLALRLYACGSVPLYARRGRMQGHGGRRSRACKRAAWSVAFRSRI